VLHNRRHHCVILVRGMLALMFSDSVTLAVKATWADSGALNSVAIFSPQPMNSTNASTDAGHRPGGFA